MTDSSTEILDAEVEEETQPEGQVEAVIDDTDEATDEARAKSQEVARSMQRLDLSLSGDIDPNDLTPAQKSAIAAILNFSPTEPGAWGNILAFMHNCVRRGLDPFNREAYLIARGKGDNRKYTMQTGIDGFLITAARTGRFIRVKHRLWTGTGDEQRDWYRDPETGIMKRVWYDQWPASRGYPGAAKAVIEHYDERGQIVTTEWVADWDMYCPTVEEWTGPPGNRRKTGNSEPTEMWKKGGPMMLAKCLPGSALIPTDQGMLPIGRVVDERLPVKVRSIDLDTGHEVWRPVVNWWTNAPTNEWVRLQVPNGTRGNRRQRITHDHPVWTPTGYVKAGELVAGDLVAQASPVLSEEQEQVVLGGLLGDASLAGRKRPTTLPHFTVSHSARQEQYALWTAEALASVGGIDVARADCGDGTGATHPTIRVRTKAAPVFYGYRGMSPVEWLDKVTDLGLAVWLMDDGGVKWSPSRTSFSLNIHCCGFGVEFADHAVEWLRDRYGIQTARVHRRDKNPYLSVGSAESAALMERLSPYIQVGSDGRKEWVAGSIEQGHEGYAFVPVLDVEHVVRAKRETRYDIEVEGTHTFLTGTGMVVSNCAIAGALRSALPGGVNGLYIHEELHRADQDEKVRIAAESRQRLVERAAARVAKPIPEDEQTAEPEPADEALSGSEGPLLPVGEPEHAEQVADEQTGEEHADAVDEAAVADEHALALLRSEAEWQAQVLGVSLPELFRRQIEAYGVQTPADLSVDGLAEVVVAARAKTARALSKTDADLAAAYTAAGRGGAIIDVKTLTG